MGSGSSSSFAIRLIEITKHSRDNFKLTRDKNERKMNNKKKEL